MTQWFNSLAVIKRGTRRGSGLMISPTELLTAAHVVAPDGTGKASALRITLFGSSRTVTPRRVAVLQAWSAAKATGSDIALVQVAPLADLGIAPVFGVPADHASATLEGHGFPDSTTREESMRGLVSFDPRSADEPFLFSSDITPLPGMSGGPLVAGIGGAVRVAGILAQRSNNDFIGLALLESVLETLRSSL